MATPSPYYDPYQPTAIPEGGATGVGSQWDWRNNAAQQALSQYYNWNALQANNAANSQQSAYQYANSAAERDARARQAAYAPTADYYSQFNQGVGNAAGYQTDAMRDRARGHLTPVSEQWEQFSQTGGFMPGQMDQLKGDAFSTTMRAANAMADSLTNSLSQRGLGADPMATAALRGQGGFEASYNRGRIGADLTKAQIQNKLTAMSGWQGSQQALADLEKGPTQESALGALSNMKQPDFNTAYGQLASPGDAGGGKGGYDSGSGKDGAGNWNMDDVMGIYNQFRTAPVGRSEPAQSGYGAAPVRQKNPYMRTMGGW